MKEAHCSDQKVMSLQEKDHDHKYKAVMKNEPLLWQFFKDSYFSPSNKLEESSFLLPLQKVTIHCVSNFEGQQYFHFSGMSF